MFELIASVVNGITSLINKKASDSAKVKAGAISQTNAKIANRTNATNLQVAQLNYQAAILNHNAAPVPSASVIPQGIDFSNPFILGGIVLAAIVLIGD